MASKYAIINPETVRHEAKPHDGSQEAPMYIDHSPEPHLANRVVVLEGGESADEIIEFSRDHGISVEDYDGDETFWIVFADEPRRVWDFTEDALRSSLRVRALRASFKGGRAS